MTPTPIVLLLLAHFVGDFLLQSDWMAQNKEKNRKAMGVHVGLYSLCLVPFGLSYAITNAAAHWLTDSVSARLTSFFWKRDQRHWFFVVIGADQLAHYAALFYSYGWFHG